MPGEHSAVLLDNDRLVHGVVAIFIAVSFRSSRVSPHCEISSPRYVFSLTLADSGTFVESPNDRAGGR